MAFIIYYNEFHDNIKKNVKNTFWGYYMNKFKDRSNISGKIINTARIENNLSLEKLSNKLELIGVRLYPNDLFLIENEKRIVKDFELMAICKVLNIDIKTVRKEID